MFMTDRVAKAQTKDLSREWGLLFFFLIVEKERMCLETVHIG